MRVTINITEEDIQRGRPGESDSCPIALATLRAIPGVRRVAVIGGSITCSAVDGLPYEYISEEVEKWTERFDKAEQVEPMIIDAEFRPLTDDDEMLFI